MRMQKLLPNSAQCSAQPWNPNRSTKRLTSLPLFEGAASQLLGLPPRHSRKAFLLLVKSRPANSVCNFATVPPSSLQHTVAWAHVSPCCLNSSATAFPPRHRGPTMLCDLSAYNSCTARRSLQNVPEPHAARATAYQVSLGEILVLLETLPLAATEAKASRCSICRLVP